MRRPGLGTVLALLTGGVATVFAAGCSSSHESGGGGGVDASADASADAEDGGGPGSGSDGAPSSCPATYADVPQFSTCSGDVSCDYDGQFRCTCTNVSDPPPRYQWECMNFSCSCSPGNDAGCVNTPCTTEADCPSGQHCGWGYGGTVCSAGCMGDGGAQTSCAPGATCVSFAP